VSLIERWKKYRSRSKFGHSQEVRRQAPIPSPETEPSSEEALTPGLPISGNLRHELRTPINLILGFCDALLNPKTPFRQPIPEPFREDIEIIFRNAQQLQNLIEKTFGSQSRLVQPERPNDMREADGDGSSGRKPKTLLLLGDDQAALQLFQHGISQFLVLHVPSLNALGRLTMDVPPVAVVVGQNDAAQVALIAELVGKQVPIVTFSLISSPQALYLHGANDYLMKPVEFAQLANALERTGTPLHEILIVDDNPDNVVILARMLDSLPQKPHISKAYSGREALALLHDQLPDVIILDFALPDMDGFTLVDYMRAETNLSHIPILLVSAHRPPEILSTARVSRYSVFHLAGISPLNLVKSIEALVSRLEGQG